MRLIVTHLAITTKTLWLLCAVGQAASLWNPMSMATFLGCLSVWMWAFRKPVSLPSAAVAALDGATYRSISPEINLKLLQLNHQLGRFWRAEAPRA
jgi:hypothetical protein